MHSNVIARTAGAWLGALDPLRAGALLLSLAYVAAYLGYPSLPGNAPLPMGWWDWADQGRYIASARALAAGNFDPAQHHYPLGYALLAAPFAAGWKQHAFFLVDLAGLLAAYAGFFFTARRIGLGGWAAVACFLLPLADKRLLEPWIIPWSTTPAAAFTWLLLAATAAHLAGGGRAGGRRPVMRLLAIGALAAAIGVTRPVDGAVAALCAGAAWLGALGWRGWRWGDPAWVALGAAAVLLPYGALHLAIYGAHPTAYMVESRDVGFAFGDIGFKAFVLLIDPSAWFGPGAGLLRRAPWLALALAGLLPALLGAPTAAARKTVALLGAAIGLSTALYLAYVDLLPPGLWRYGNLHYFKWAVPGCALLALLWARHLLAGRRGAALAGLAFAAALVSLRLEPRPVAADAPARMVDLIGPQASWRDAYFGTLALQDAAGRLETLRDMRLLPRIGGPGEGGVRAIALRRDFVGPLGWAPGSPPPPGPITATQRYQGELGLGWPCFLPPYACPGAGVAIAAPE